MVRERCMNRSDTEQNSASRAIDANSANTRLTGFRLIIARVLWLALVVPGLVLFLASLPAFDQQLQRGCVTCSLNGALSAQGLQALSTIGISASEYATLLTIFFAIITAIWCGVDFLIFWLFFS